MDRNLRFEFEVIKDSNTIVLKREFVANLELVCKSWTTVELLDQWWGPEPCKAETKSMDFREGGHWLYCMVIPPSLTGAETVQRSWGIQHFEKIVLHQNFSGKDGFCDENGTINPELPIGDFEN